VIRSQICDLFSVECPKGVRLFIEDPDVDLRTATLYFSRAQSMHFASDSTMVGSIELIAGEGEVVNELVYLGVFREVSTLNGFLSEGSEETGYFEFSGRFIVDGKEFSQHHTVISSGAGYSVHIRFLQGYSEIDINEIENMMARANFLEKLEIPIIGENVQMQFDESKITFKIGNQSHLEVA